MLVILAAFAVWLEPTRVVWSWLRGEAFYEGRPTSWWREELQRWSYVQALDFDFENGGLAPVGEKSSYRSDDVLQRHFPTLFKKNREWRTTNLPLMNGDIAARGVVVELLESAELPPVGLHYKDFPRRLE